MKDAKERSKAMKIIVDFSGVISMRIEGEYMNQIMIKGKAIDPVAITKLLRKKMRRHVDVVSVSMETKDEPQTSNTRIETVAMPPIQPCTCPYMHAIPYDAEQNPSCSIM
ncbi:hypothetical protein J5N97_008081 [Dioscorea zingiberensis]|uniref:HMA domain-containing protein n=1 Tax=Dioscorea zingiberensis TaxID=325984 RepID=A0A9D5DFY7_9LILI|nr:hypothetical protein J5N97_008081 [Dioscorea zingiberensis]